MNQRNPYKKAMNRRNFIYTTFAASLATGIGAALFAQGKKSTRILLRSSWQTVNIGDIAHTPGMLALLEKYRPDAEVTLWPSSVAGGVEEILLARFPKLKIAKTEAAQEAALAECDFFLHGSGPMLVGLKELILAKKAGKPYGIGGVTLNDWEIRTTGNCSRVRSLSSSATPTPCVRCKLAASPDRRLISARMRRLRLICAMTRRRGR
jgi:hypothetical protein